MASPPAPPSSLPPLDSITASALEPHPVPQPQPDALPLDAQSGLAEPLRQLQSGATRENDQASALIQSPTFVERKGNSMEKLPSIDETPDKRKQREKDDAERKRREQESLEFQQRFDLSPTEPLIEDYSCAHTATGAIYQGRLYLSKSYMCFYSPLFSKLLRVNIRKLVEIEKRSTLGVFPNGIEVTTENGKKISFISFIYREQAYNTLCRLVKELKELGAAPPPTPHSEELPNIVTPPVDGEDHELRNSNARRSLSRSLSYQQPGSGSRSTSPVPEDDKRPEEKRGSRVESNLRQASLQQLERDEHEILKPGTPALPAAIASHVPTPAPAVFPVTVTPPTPLREKDSPLVQLRRSEDPAKGSKDNLVAVAKEKEKEKEREKEKEKEKDNLNAIKEMSAGMSTSQTTFAAFTAPIVTSSADLMQARPDSSPPRNVLPVTPVDPLAIVPVTDKCTHLNQLKGAPVLTSTISLSLGVFFRRVMGDGTNTWMLALRDPNADTYFTMTPWSLCKEKCCLTRKLEFQVPYQAPLRTAVTRVVQEHTIRLVKPDYIVFESSSQSLDVPYSDSFMVITRIDMESTTVDPASPSCHLAFRTEVKWLKSVWMLKSTIESKSVEGNTAFLTQWLDVVKRKATEIDTPDPPRIETTRGEQKVVDEKPMPSSATTPPTVATVPPSPRATLAPLQTHQSPLRVSTSMLHPQAASGHSLPFSSSSLLIGIGLLFLLLVFLFLRVSSMESQLGSLRGANDRLERRLVFMQSFVSALSANVTGQAGPFKEQVAHWQAYEAFRRQLAQGREMTRTAATLLERMAQQQADYELTLSRAVAEQSANVEQTAVLFAEAADTSASWGASLVALVLTAVLAVVADLYLMSGAITFRILRRKNGGNPNNLPTGNPN